MSLTASSSATCLAQSPAPLPSKEVGGGAEDSNSRITWVLGALCQELGTRTKCALYYIPTSVKTTPSGAWKRTGWLVTGQALNENMRDVHFEGPGVPPPGRRDHGCRVPLAQCRARGGLHCPYSWSCAYGSLGRLQADWLLAWFLGSSRLRKSYQLSRD